MKSCEDIFGAELFVFLINPSCEKAVNVKGAGFYKNFVLIFGD